MSESFPYDKSVLDLSDKIERTDELIGRGAYGTVYKGRWLSTAINPTPAIAIKIIDLVPLTDEAKRKKRFKQTTRELSLWCNIQHENILPLLGIARINGDTNIPAFVCPWMENGNAKEFCSRNPRFPRLLILYDIINGLHYLHTFKPEIVHGDIKAVNVLINNRCEACLCDFGLSRFIIDDTFWKTTATGAGGTPRWMAPELVNGNVSNATKESDIYAYAMTCYEILSGGLPFQSVLNDMAILYKVAQGQRPDRIESFHSDFMWDIITRCWEQEPKDRLPTEKVLGLLRPKVDWKGVEDEQAKKGVALAKVEKEMAVLKEQMAKAEEDLKGLKEEKEETLKALAKVLNEKNAVWAKEMAVLKEQMAEAQAQAEEDMKVLKEEKEKTCAKAEEVLNKKAMAWAKEMAVLKEQMAEAEEDMKEEKEETLKALAEVLNEKDVAWAKEMAKAQAQAEKDMKALKEEKEKACANAKVLNERDVAWAKEWAVLKEQMARAQAKAEKDMKALKEEKERACANAKVLNERDVAWAREMAVLKEQMAKAQVKAEKDIKALKEEKERKPKEDLKKKPSAKTEKK